MARRDDRTIELPANTSSGLMVLRAEFNPSYAAIINTSGALVSLINGEYMHQPNGAIPVEAGNYLSFNIEAANAYTIFYNAPGLLSNSNNKLVIRLSDEPLILQGGSLDGSNSTSNVEIVGIPTVNIGGVLTTIYDGTQTVNVGNVPHVEIDGSPTVQIGGTPTVNVGNIPHVVVDSLPDVGINKPLPSGTNTIGKVEVVSDISTYKETGMTVAPDTSQPLSLTSIPTVMGVMLQNYNTNMNNSLFVRNTGESGYGFELVKGAAVVLPFTDLSDISIFNPSTVNTLLVGVFYRELA
ncbi:hypothetical protein D3C73_858630 [compost metagenome]